MQPGYFSRTQGARSLSTLDSRYAQHALVLGEGSVPREEVTSVALVTSTQVLRLTYFTARKTETTTQVRVWSTGTAAGATPTLCRIGLYLIDSSDGGTLVASIANDTTLFAAANTSYTRSWSSSYVKQSGQRYALGILVVTAAATPTFAGSGVFSASLVAEVGASPRMSGLIAGQADLPSSFTNANVTNSQQRFYGAILP